MYKLFLTNVTGLWSHSSMDQHMCLEIVVHCLSQNLQVYGLSPVWINICAFKVAACTNCVWQNIWLLLGLNQYMLFETYSLCKLFLVQVTRIRFITSMDQHMFLEAAGLRIMFLPHITDIRFLFSMNYRMSLEITSVSKLLSTQLTCMLSLQYGSIYAP